MRAQLGGADLIEAISTIAAYETASALLPMHVIRAVMLYGLTEQADGVADLIVPRLQTELPTLLSEGFLAAALSNRKVAGELANHVTEYVRPLQGPKQVDVRADLFATLVDANGPRDEVVRMADELIGTVQSYPASAPRAIQALLFRDRWMVAEDTFRPPWYHKNIMSELMGNIYGVYDAKPKGFVPGGMSLHNMMLPHGPDRNAFEGASNAALKAEKLIETMSFMFETRFPQHLTRFAATEAPLQDDYIDCWADLEKKFDGRPERK